MTIGPESLSMLPKEMLLESLEFIIDCSSFAIQRKQCVFCNLLYMFCLLGCVVGQYCLQHSLAML
jgi:hypothetical protein